jgi:flavin-dependent dehydrogenase
MRTDVLVAGAGPAGATVARLLALRDCKVVAVDPFCPGVERLEILAPSTCRLIAAAGLGQIFQDPSIARPCLGIRRRWGTSRAQNEDFFCRPGGQGFVIDRRPFDQALRAAACAAGVRFVRGRVKAAGTSPRHATVEVLEQNGEVTIESEIVIEATGRVAAVAGYLGVHRIFMQRLLAEKLASPDLAPSASGPVWLKVDGDPDGWSYSVSGPDGRQESWEVFHPGRRSPDRNAPQCGPRVDASSARLTSVAGEGWMAVGDAALSFDPVTSQGLANAFSTAIAAAGYVLSSLDSDRLASAEYSQALFNTFAYSERGRAQIYSQTGGNSVPSPSYDDHETPKSVSRQNLVAES